MRDYVQTQSCDSTINGNPVKGSVIRTFRFREFQDDPTNLNRVYLKAVKRDPDNAENPLGVPLADDETAHPLWNQTTLFCPDIPDPELPQISEPVVFTEGIKTCKEQWGASYEGTRTGYVRKVVYPEGWPVRQTESKYVDDDCFLPVPNAGIQNGTDACQAGYEGIITKNCELSWFNRLWAITDNYYPTFGRRMPITVNIHDAVFWSGIDQSPLIWHDRVTAGSWNITSNTCQIICDARYQRIDKDTCQIICPSGYVRVDNNTCRRISSESEGGSQNGNSFSDSGGSDPNSDVTWDTDFDGITVSYTPDDYGGIDPSEFSSEDGMGSSTSYGEPSSGGQNEEEEDEPE